LQIFVRFKKIFELQEGKFLQKFILKFAKISLRGMEDSEDFFPGYVKNATVIDLCNIKYYVEKGLIKNHVVFSMKRSVNLTHILFLRFNLTLMNEKDTEI
jgi:hypothetical protein